MVRRLRLRTRGVKVMLLSEAGEVLLIRNTYGRTDLWVLPGGGIRPWERPQQAARREVAEEVGCAIARLTFVSTHFNEAEGKRDRIHLFRGLAIGAPEADALEVEEAAFFPLDGLPESISSATLRRIEEHLGRREPDGGW